MALPTTTVELGENVLSAEPVTLPAMTVVAPVYRFAPLSVWVPRPTLVMPAEPAITPAKLPVTFVATSVAEVPPRTSAGVPEELVIMPDPATFWLT